MTHRSVVLALCAGIFAGLTLYELEASSREVICQGEQLADLELVSVTLDGVEEPDMTAYRQDDFVYDITGFDDELQLRVYPVGAESYQSVFDIWAVR